MGKRSPLIRAVFNESINYVLKDFHFAKNTSLSEEYFYMKAATFVIFSPCEKIWV